MLQFGFESISNETLRSMNKQFNIKRDYRMLVKKCHDHGIEVGASFIFGWDTDTKDVFKNTVEFALDTDIDIPGYLPLTPFPGTEIYKELMAQNRIITNDWSKYNWNTCVYKPKNMTSGELLDGCYYAFEESYSTRSIFHRLFSRPRGFKESMLLLLFSGLGRYVILQSKSYWRTEGRRRNIFHATVPSHIRHELAVDDK